ncbi:AraC family transcriptional regulator [Bradyrhizobium sp. BRP23]|uniref:helix-turn-helix domain-containing protein n=1 Tax=Bradyrhizobium sp. BRP23 TaxID=2793820 RepID=UPI001CD43091|nr:AraC family transcriptional regulator [Bradyrhizobium sp. BRP23]MCA1385493.1 helix-turn-helix transcriptional regulator [Bradyrhizobium sp. BRP05]MCA1422238.1 helix-turn-helix transcriptional regulator [Bradyrhizobium sp. BRP23]
MTSPSGFQELAISTPPSGGPKRARMLDWDARVLYLGPAFGLTPHRNATGVLAVALDGAIGVANDPRARSPSYRQARSVLIMPNSLHHLRIDAGRTAFLYVDPLGRDIEALRSRMKEVGSNAAFDLIDEISVVALFGDIAERRLASEDAQQAARDMLGIGSSAQPDARIAAAIKRMREQPSGSHTLAELGRKAGLSSSRFLHLFKDVTGVPLRRYRIWSRIGAAARAVAQGQSLTEAAHGAGFSSSAHFSTAFRDMFGMMPSELFARVRAG